MTVSVKCVLTYSKNVRSLQYYIMSSPVQILGMILVSCQVYIKCVFVY